MKKKSILTGTINCVITQEWKDSLAGEGFAMKTGIWAPESLLNKQWQGQQKPVYLNMDLQSQWWEGGDIVNPWASLPRQPHLLSDLQASERSCLRKNTRWCHKRNGIYIHVHTHVCSHDISPNAHTQTYDHSRAIQRKIESSVRYSQWCHRYISFVKSGPKLLDLEMRALRMRDAFIVTCEWLPSAQITPFYFPIFLLSRLHRKGHMNMPFWLFYFAYYHCGL